MHRPKELPVRGLPGEEHARQWLHARLAGAGVIRVGLGHHRRCELIHGGRVRAGGAVGVGAPEEGIGPPARAPDAEAALQADGWECIQHALHPAVDLPARRP